MAKQNAFAKEILQLLKRSKFPQGLELEEALRQHHAIVTALNNRVLALLGARLDQDLYSQGLKGGGSGGPHRMDLALQFSLDADKETLKNTAKLLKNLPKINLSF